MLYFDEEKRKKNMNNKLKAICLLLLAIIIFIALELLSFLLFIKVSKALCIISFSLASIILVISLFWAIVKLSALNKESNFFKKANKYYSKELFAILKEKDQITYQGFKCFEYLVKKDQAEVIYYALEDFKFNASAKEYYVYKNIIVGYEL